MGGENGAKIEREENQTDPKKRKTEDSFERKLKSPESDCSSWECLTSEIGVIHPIITNLTNLRLCVNLMRTNVDSQETHPGPEKCFNRSSELLPFQSYMIQQDQLSNKEISTVKSFERGQARKRKLQIAVSVVLPPGFGKHRKQTWKICNHFLIAQDQKKKTPAGKKRKKFSELSNYDWISLPQRANISFSLCPPRFAFCDPSNIELAQEELSRISLGSNPISAKPKDKPRGERGKGEKERNGNLRKLELYPCKCKVVLEFIPTSSEKCPCCGNFFLAYNLR